MIASPFWHHIQYMQVRAIVDSLQLCICANVMRQDDAAKSAFVSPAIMQPRHDFLSWIASFVECHGGEMVQGERSGGVLAKCAGWQPGPAAADLGESQTVVGRHVSTTEHLMVAASKAKLAFGFRGEVKLGGRTDAERAELEGFQ